jgi:hypothetical protein
VVAQQLAQRVDGHALIEQPRGKRVAQLVWSDPDACQFGVLAQPVSDGAA